MMFFGVYTGSKYHLLYGDFVMTRRFYNVLRGARGDLAKQKFLDHLKGMGQGENVGTKGNRPNSIKLYVVPFGQTLPANLYFQVSAFEQSWNGLRTFAPISQRTKAAITGTETAVKVRGYKPARIVQRTQTGNTGVAATSKLTGLKYLKYNTTSISVPIGRKDGTDTEIEAFEEAVAALPANAKVTLINEVM